MDMPRSSASAGKVKTYIAASWPSTGSALPNGTWFHHVRSVIHWLDANEAMRNEAIAARSRTSGRTCSRVGNDTVKPSRVVKLIGAGDIEARARRAWPTNQAIATAKLTTPTRARARISVA